MNQLLLNATIETLIMVGISTSIGLLFGIPFAILLFGSDKNGLFENQIVKISSDFFVNIVRSIPYIILVIALLPVTRFIVGSSLGTYAASVPLSLASIMLVTRLAEESFRSVPRGLIEAALSMGATKWQIIYKIIIPESLPSLITAATLVIINLIGFSAMAGAVGGGGLGDLAIRYGYQRYNTEIIVEIIVILVIFVQLVQIGGDKISRYLSK